MLLNLSRSVYTKYLILLILGVAIFASAQDTKLPPDVRISEGSKLDILLTHIHPDHSGGLTVGGRRIFPNATVRVNKLELEYWTNKSLGEKAPEPTKTFFQQADQTVTHTSSRDT